MWFIRGSFLRSRSYELSVAFARFYRVKRNDKTASVLTIPFRRHKQTSTIRLKTRFSLSVCVVPRIQSCAFLGSSRGNVWLPDRNFSVYISKECTLVWKSSEKEKTKKRCERDEEIFGRRTIQKSSWRKFLLNFCFIQGDSRNLHAWNNAFVLCV